MSDSSDRLSLLQEDKLFMVLSRAGKPIFCCSETRGIQNESHFADVMAAAQALLSASRCLGAGQHLKSCKSFGGSHRTLYFLEKPHLFLFVVSHHNEPLLMLKMQLVLLHAQILSLLPMSGLTSLFEKSPGYDLRKLLTGSEQILSKLIYDFAWTPSTVLGAYPMVVMSPGAREDMRAAVFDSLVKTRARFGVVLSQNAVVTNVSSVFRRSKNSTGLDHWDVLLLMNFVSANSVSLSQASETVTTICMPFFDSHGNFFAYIRYIDSSTIIVFLSGSPIDDIYSYQEACVDVKVAWDSVKTVSLDEIVENCVSAERTNLSMDRYHFVFKNSITGQYVWNASRTPHGIDLDSIIIRYGSMRAGMFALDGESPNRGPLQAFRLEESREYIFIAFASIEAEFFMCINTSMSSEQALECAQHLKNSLVSQSSFLFSSSL